jgi:hypothetical protein
LYVGQADRGETLGLQHAEPHGAWLTHSDSAVASRSSRAASDELVIAIETTATIAWSTRCGVRAESHDGMPIEVRDLSVLRLSSPVGVAQAALALPGGSAAGEMVENGHEERGRSGSQASVTRSILLAGRPKLRRSLHFYPKLRTTLIGQKYPGHTDDLGELIRCGWVRMTRCEGREIEGARNSFEPHGGSVAIRISASFEDSQQRYVTATSS